MNLRATLATRRQATPAAAWDSGKLRRCRGAGGPVDRVLFLDFDGVLHPTVMEADPGSMETVIGVGLFGWLQALESALQPHPDVGVVVHSTWRRTHDDDELRMLLGGLGPRMLGSTPPGMRYESIQAWLRANPDVVSHRILDDESNEFPQPLPAELILCDPTSGVAARDVLAALRMWLSS